NAYSGSYDLTSVNLANLCGGGSCGTITTTLNASGGIDVSVVLNAPYVIFGSGNGNGAFGFNVVNPDNGVSISNICSTVGANPAVCGAGSGFSSGNGGNFDGFGNYEFSLSDGQSNDGHTSLSFTVTRTAGFTNANQLEELPNGTGGFFVAHIFNPNLSQGAQTGY